MAGIEEEVIGARLLVENTAIIVAEANAGKPGAAPK
jgi:hypothetical protein